MYLLIKMRASPAIFGAKEPEWDIESEKCYACNAIIESRNNCRACGKVSLTIVSYHIL